MVDAGYRYSDYSSGVTTDTYKFELQYAPMADFRLRASYNRAIRAPTIVELFVPQLVGKIAFGEDPCAPGETTGVAAESSGEVPQYRRDGRAVRQWRQHQHHSAGHGRTADAAAGRQPGPAPGTGGHLHPGRDASSPRRCPHFTGSIDYYRIKLKDAVGSLDAQIIMRNCLDTGDPTYCSQLVASTPHRHAEWCQCRRRWLHRADQRQHRRKPLEGIDVQAAYTFGPGRTWAACA